MTTTTSVKPQSYDSLLDRKNTIHAVGLVRTLFSTRLSESLNLTWVPAPQILGIGTGLNDDLNGLERPVSFLPPDLGGVGIEVVQSLAKWKRVALSKLDMRPGEGIYADLNAIRPDEVCDPLHSLTVDQWEWELSIGKGDRTVSFLKQVVNRIYESLQYAENQIALRYPILDRLLPERVTFIHSEDLLTQYPGCSPQEREDLVTRQHGAVFVIGVGAALRDGEPHDGRAPDYDDWSTPNGRGVGLNGDLLVWHPVLECAIELSSMGIRVNRKALLRQLRIRGVSHWQDREFHRRLLEGRLPLSAGGGIGKSRVSMYLLRKAHIGEVQASVWSRAVHSECQASGIELM